MPVCQIADVDIIAHTGAVGRGIIAAVNVNKRKLSGGNLCHIGQEVVRNAVRCFAYKAAFVRADRIKNTEET